MSDDNRYLLRREEQGSASRVARQCGPSLGSLRNLLIAAVHDSSTKAMAHSVEMVEPEMLQVTVIRVLF
jgi:hypothetical protein